MSCEVYHHTKFVKYLALGEEKNLWHLLTKGVWYKYVTCTTHGEKCAKYAPHKQTLRTTTWQVNPLITIPTCVRGITHEQPIKDLKKLKIYKNEIKIPNTKQKEAQQQTIPPP